MNIFVIAAPGGERQRLDLWIKGPVFYDRDVSLGAVQAEDGVDFGLALAGDPRFAIAGSWRSG